MTPAPDRATFPTLIFETSFTQAGYTRIAGIDEAGRGAWAGPVCAAAVILPIAASIQTQLAGVRDSKLMTPRARLAWAPCIQAASLGWGVGFASAAEIDALGILPATRLAAVRALQDLTPGPLWPDALITDYLIFRELDLPQNALIKGDQLSLSVAAASVLAKTARDACMCASEADFPGYDFARHKGYGTRLHQQAIRRMGLCDFHRKSFAIPA